MMLMAKITLIVTLVMMVGLLVVMTLIVLSRW